MNYDRHKLDDELDRDEGNQLETYRDTLGVLTCGRGWNLEANGIPADVRGLLTGNPFQVGYRWPAEACAQLGDKAVQRAEAVVRRLVPASETWDQPVRMRALLNMAYNLDNRLVGFARFLAHVNEGNWAAAASELNAVNAARWRSQVHDARVDRLQAMILTGEEVA